MCRYFLHRQSPQRSPLSRIPSSPARRLLYRFEICIRCTSSKLYVKGFDNYATILSKLRSWSTTSALRTKTRHHRSGPSHSHGYHLPAEPRGSDLTGTGLLGTLPSLRYNIAHWSSISDYSHSVILGLRACGLADGNPRWDLEISRSITSIITGSELSVLLSLITMIEVVRQQGIGSQDQPEGTSRPDAPSGRVLKPIRPRRRVISPVG